MYEPRRWAKKRLLGALAVYLRAVLLTWLVVWAFFPWSSGVMLVK